MKSMHKMMAEAESASSRWLYEHDSWVDVQQHQDPPATRCRLRGSASRSPAWLPWEHPAALSGSGSSQSHLHYLTSVAGQTRWSTVARSSIGQTTSCSCMACNQKPSCMEEASCGACECTASHRSCRLLTSAVNPGASFGNCSQAPPEGINIFQ